MSNVRMVVDGKCPACTKEAGWPTDGESEDVFACLACGVKLVIKAAPFETPMRAWLVTLESEREAVALARRKS